MQLIIDPFGKADRYPRWLVICAVAMVAVLWTSTTSFSVRAQTASPITLRSFAPPVPARLGGGSAIGATAGRATPPGAEKLFVRLSGVSIEGGFQQFGAAEAVVRAKLSSPRISGADLFAAARELEAAYAQAGYVLVLVVLPPQRLADGATLRLSIVDEYIERVEARDVADRVRDRILAILEPLRGAAPMPKFTIKRAPAAHCTNCRGISADYDRAAVITHDQMARPTIVNVAILRMDHL